MITDKSIPCSLYDIQGVQNWLDEMALNGLFFQDFPRRRHDTARFLVDNPRPVRYRLDPVGKGKQEDLQRREPYAQMGWLFVAALPRMYGIYSCEDPDAPELHSDPATLAYALNSTIRQQIQYQGVRLLITAACALLMLFLIRRRLLEELLLLEQPRLLFQLALPLAAFALSILVFLLQIRKLVKTRRVLEEGLTPRPGRRWNRPYWMTVYWCVAAPLLLISCFLIPDYLPQVCGLGEAPLSHAWPTLAQLEAVGPRPLAEEPEVEGYLKRNSSWFVPVQEFVSTDWEVRTFDPDTGEVTSLDRPYRLWNTVQYDRARSPGTARLVYQLRRDQEARQRNEALSYDNPLSRVSDLQPVQALEYPGLDALETVRYRRGGANCWLFTALRGNDILVAEYSGPTALEDCLPLFLEALNH